MDVRVGLWRKLSTEELMLEQWCWKRLLRVPWTARRSNQSILKEISPGCSLKGLMLKLKLQYCGHRMQRAGSFEKTLMLGKIEGGRRRGRQRMRWLDGITDSMDMSLGNSGSWWWTGRPSRVVVYGVTKSRTRLSDWTELKLTYPRVAPIFLSQVINALLKSLFLLLSGTFRKLLFMLRPSFTVVFGSRETIFCVMLNIKYFWDKNNIYSWCHYGIF